MPRLQTGCSERKGQKRPQEGLRWVIMVAGVGGGPKRHCMTRWDTGRVWGDSGSWGVRGSLFKGKMNLVGGLTMWGHLQASGELSH